MNKRINANQKVLPSLTVSREEAEKKIEVQIKKGKEIKNLNILDRDGLDRARLKRKKWSKYNTELLSRLFTDSTLADEYNHFGGAVIPMNPSLEWLIKDFDDHIDESITRLESIVERLELIPEPMDYSKNNNTNKSKKGISSKKIFIVHGYDEAAKESTSRFLEKLGLTTIILHEQPSAGRTIIEKVEYYSDVTFAVVLLTPDDIAAPKHKPEDSEARARQNVIFELGYFIGKLGRDKVCALYKKDVAIPTDYLGVLYIEMDAKNGWKLQLAKEIKQAGIEIDLNKVM